MTVTGDPFRAARVPSSPTGPECGAIHVQSGGGPWPFVPSGGNPYPATEQPYNPLAVLSPVFAVVVPPVAVVLGHWALVQIRRSGELGRSAAISGLIIGYLLTVVLMSVIGWASTGSESAETARSSDNTISASPLPRELPPTIVTSVAPPPSRPRAKLNLAQVVTGTCAEIQKRDLGDDALDLFGVPCEHRQGVYSVVGRVAAHSDCRSTYVAAPPDHSFALCLNEY